jgi:transcriptional regulator with GAF, ATPase, and Fis domain
MWQARSSKDSIEPAGEPTELAEPYSGTGAEPMHLGVLKELVLSLLNQLELLRGSEQHEPNPAPSNFYDEVRRFEIELINDALCRTHGHQQKAARLLGVKPTTLNSKIKRYNIMFPYFSKVSGL